MRVVNDTNVVVSAALKNRTPEEVILFIAGQEDFEWIVLPAIVEEYNEVLYGSHIKIRTRESVPPAFLQGECLNCEPVSCVFCI